MSVTNYINVSLEIWGCVISAIVMLCLFLGKRQQDICSKLYLGMLLFNIGAMFFDMLALFSRGHTGDFFWWSVRISNFIAFCCNYMLMVVFVHYLTEYLGKRVAVSPKPLLFSRIICFLSLTLVVLTQFCPIIYTIDNQNIYHRAELFWLSHAMGLICIVICAGMLIKYRNATDPREKAALWVYLLLPLAALLIQMFVYGPVFLSLANTISLVIIFLFLQAEQGRRLAEQETALAQERIAIMLSQIQPHFLYNVLNTIHYLCISDPNMAQKAVDDFATYLRGNLDSLKRKTPVTFEKELEHIRTYLSLEKMRFDDELNVIYDIETRDFLLPALTVQPLVENAVKHGLCAKAGGGTVTIATREYPDHYEILVTDDGVGFDPYAEQADGRTHIGIDNVRTRLWVMSGGNLKIASCQGEGTVATVSLPKARQNIPSLL